MEAGDPLPSVWRQGHEVFRPGASDTSHHTKNARAAVEGDGGRWHCSANVVSAGAAQSGIPADGVGAISLSRTRRYPKMGGSSPDTGPLLAAASPFITSDVIAAISRPAHIGVTGARGLRLGETDDDPDTEREASDHADHAENSAARMAACVLEGNRRQDVRQRLRLLCR